MFAKNSSFPVRLLSSLMILILMFGSGGVTPAHAGGGGGGDADYYVKPGGGGDCSTWAQACDLQTALGLASSGQTIWVAAGLYKPTASTSERSATFQLRTSVPVYGGFNGTETSLDQRDPLTNVTILSGDIDNNDSQTPIITDPFTVTGNAANSYHVVTGASASLLDGFIITAGAANDGSACPLGCGGGIFNTPDSNPILSNITFSGNIAWFGGGVYSASTPELINVYLGNNAAYYGGGMYNDGTHTPGTNPYLTDVTFSDNSAVISGGGMFNYNSNPDMENIIFRGNTAPSGGGGGLFNAGTRNGVLPMQLTHVTFEGNAAFNGGGMYNDNGTNLTMIDVTFSGNVSSSDGGGMSNNLNSSPTLTNVTFFANTAVDQGGGLYNITDSSPTLKNITFQYNSANEGGGIYNSMNSNPVIRNTILWGNPGAGGAQIYNDATSTPVVSDSIIEGGYAGGSYIHTFDPKLGTFGDHGGFTHTISLLPGSPAVDSGWDPDCATTDQRGIFRPQGPYCDIGAYEFVATFADVPTNYWAWQFVERLYNYGVTGGCGGGNYCPSGNVTRAQMAVFLLKSKYGTSYSPPPASGTVFADVASDYWAAAWIEALAAENITGGCGGGNYCPNGNVTRAQMAVFLLRAKYGSSYYPPAATGSFADVPIDYWAASWIEQLAVEGITGGCGGGKYCPEGVVSRAEMAPFLVVTFGLP